MILGLSTATFTEMHVIVSLIGIVSGIIVLAGMLSSSRLGGWTGLFLATTVLTSVTGFFLPADHLLPSHIVGMISLVVLALRGERGARALPECVRGGRTRVPEAGRS